MTDDICRNDPPYNSSYLIELPLKPSFKFVITDLEILQKWDYYNTRYTLLLNGYNFNIPTKNDPPNNYRKIQIGKPTYNKLMEEFIRFEYLYNMVNKHDWTTNTITDYIENTTKPTLIKYDDDLQNIKNQNKLSQTLWDSIRHKLQNKINELTEWTDFIEYENVKYGLKPIVNKVHRENNCLGNITDTQIFKEPCRCSSCENWGGCNRDSGSTNWILQCDKCEYKHQYTFTNYRSNKPWR